jgi:hypothetical protein
VDSVIDCILPCYWHLHSVEGKKCAPIRVAAAAAHAGCEAVDAHQIADGIVVVDRSISSFIDDRDEATEVVVAIL